MMAHILNRAYKVTQPLAGAQDVRSHMRKEHCIQMRSNNLAHLVRVMACGYCGACFDVIRLRNDHIGAHYTSSKAGSWREWSWPTVFEVLRGIDASIEEAWQELRMDLARNPVLISHLHAIEDAVGYALHLRLSIGFETALQMIRHAKQSIRSTITPVQDHRTTPKWPRCIASADQQIKTCDHCCPQRLPFPTRNTAETISWPYEPVLSLCGPDWTQEDQEKLFQSFRSL